MKKLCIGLILLLLLTLCCVLVSCDDADQAPTSDSTGTEQGETAKPGSTTTQPGGNTQSDNTQGTKQPDPAKQNFTGLTLTETAVNYNGSAHTLALAGDVPEGATVTYTGGEDGKNGATNAGTYNIRVTVSMDGYNDFVATATLTINKLDFTGLSLAGATVDYDGSAHALTVAGAVPDGATVTYTGGVNGQNSATNAGTYNIGVIVSKPNYNNFTASATLTINKATLSGVTFSNATFDYDGQKHTIAVTGNVPAGATVTYTGGEDSQNGATAINQYTITATITHANYQTFTATATLQIKKPSLTMAQVKAYLSQLLTAETATAYDYIPEAMHPSYAANAVTASAINYDFTSFTNVSGIQQAGFGEQWQMVVENIDQSVAMAKVFNVAQTTLNAAGTLVDAYITNSFAEEMSYNFSGEGFTGLFAFQNDKLIFNVTVTKSVTVPIAGTVQPVIKMEYDLEKDAKGIFIRLGDAYEVKYVIADNAYEMATTYGITIAGKDVSRSSYLSVVQANGKTTGHIYEYTTYEDSDKIKACADFYVENGYVSVVGNKASGMLAFDGYINELYLANAGRLLGYEVREEKTIASVKATYNTLWFNLWDIQGINTVKVLDKTNANQSSRSTVDVYLNGSASLLSPTYNTKIIKTSRKYDVELRSRFYYTYDVDKEEYVANEVKVPMIFIQEGANYDSFTSDMQNDNGITASVALNPIYLNKILSDYDTLIDIFIQNKENMSSQEIIDYLAQYE